MPDLRYASTVVAAALLGLASPGCSPAGDDEVTRSVREAEDNAPDPPNGTACYVDGPHVDKSDWYHKGHIETGKCCFTMNCYSCNDYYECQAGGSKPGARSTEPVLANPGNQSGLLGAYVSLGHSVDGGTMPYTWSASGLPPGLSIDPVTSIVGGVPSAGGIFSVSVGVTDASDPPQTVVTTYAWTIFVAVPDIVGLDLVGASWALDGVGLALGSEADRVVSTCDDTVGTVLAQTPGPGTVVWAGSAVDFTFGVRPSGRSVCE